MFRRIELIAHSPADLPDRKMFDWKAGLMYIPTKDSVAEAWDTMPAPTQRIHKNCRFYFTEKGWKLYGREVVKACQRVGQEYRMIRIKEDSVEVVYRDEVQAVVRPLRKRRPPEE